MSDYKQAGFNFGSELSRRLQAIERLAKLTPVATRALYVSQRTGEIARLRNIQKTLTDNMHNLRMYWVNHELSPEDQTLAESLFNQNKIMYDQAQEKIQALKLIEERKRSIDGKR